MFLAPADLKLLRLFLLDLLPKPAVFADFSCSGLGQKRQKQARRPDEPRRVVFAGELKDQ